MTICEACCINSVPSKNDCVHCDCLVLLFRIFLAKCRFDELVGTTSTPKHDLRSPSKSLVAMDD